MRSRLLLPFLLAAACAPTLPPVAATPLVRREAPSPAPAPAPPPLAADWRDWPQAPGVWRYRRDERGSVALFGRPGGDAVAVLRCDLRLGRVFLSRAGTQAGPLTVRTTSMSRVLATGVTGSTPAYVAATLAPSDPLLDAIAFSRGRFALDQPGAAPLALPAWAEIGRVIEDCRS